MILLCIFSASITVSCSSEVIDTEIRMEFHGDDSGKYSDIGIYVSAAYAEYITSEICAILPEDAHMKDDNLPAYVSFHINITDNKMLFSNNIYEKIYPASTTKLMTALLLLKYGDLADNTVVSEKNGGITVPGAKLCGFNKGDRLSIETLLNCILIYSGNDACIIAAEYLCETEEAFVRLMNEEAALLGAVDTNFINSHGLHDKEHYTTAYDMYLIFMECIKYDEFIQIIKKPNYVALYKDINGEPLSNNFESTNMFLIGTIEAPIDITVYGGKTGSTGDAGDCLIMLSEKTDENGSHTYYISGVFKASSKNSLYSQISYLIGME